MDYEEKLKKHKKLTEAEILSLLDETSKKEKEIMESLENLSKKVDIVAENEKKKKKVELEKAILERVEKLRQKRKQTEISEQSSLSSSSTTEDFERFKKNNDVSETEEEAFEKIAEKGGIGRTIINLSQEIVDSVISEGKEFLSYVSLVGENGINWNDDILLVTHFNFWKSQMDNYPQRCIIKDSNDFEGYVDFCWCGRKVYINSGVIDINKDDDILYLAKIYLARIYLEDKKYKGIIFVDKNSKFRYISREDI